MKKNLMTYVAGRLVFAIFSCCAMTTVVNAQNTVEDLLKAAEQKASLADKNPTNGKMQYEAAKAFIYNDLGEKKDYDRALIYANRAYKIALEHPAPQDTLKGFSCHALSWIYMGKQSWDNAFDFMDMTMDAFEEELGQFDPVTNGTKLTFGYMMLGAQPVRGFNRIQEAFRNNDLAPQYKRIDNMMQAGIVHELSLEMYMAEMSKRYHNCIPRIYVDCKPYYIVQTPDWNIERPLVGWMVPKLLRSEAEDKAYDGDPLIICDENLQFKVIPKEEKDKYPMDFSFFYQFANPRHLEFRDCSAGMIFFSPADFDRVLKKYREFKAANK